MNFYNLKDLTVLILTYKRHKELINKIEYLSHYNYKVLIIDGSPKPISKNLYYKNKKISYHHFPTENYQERIFFAEKFLKTKYVKIESDNDYFVPSSMSKSVEFLNKNINYSAVIGKCGIYSTFNKKVYIKQIFPNHKNLIKNSVYKRCDEYMQIYSPALYHSVCRTRIFKEKIKLWKKCKKIYKNEFHHFAEICLPLLCLTGGKLKCLDFLTWVRADDKIEKRLNYIGVIKLMPKADKHHFYASKLLKLSHSGYFNSFFSLFEKQTLKKNNQILYFKDLKKIYERYIFLRTKISKKSLITSRLIKIATSALPSILKKNIRFFLRKNGPELKEIINNSCKVNYRYNKSELIEINNSICKLIL